MFPIKISHVPNQGSPDVSNQDGMNGPDQDGPNVSNHGGSNVMPKMFLTELAPMVPFNARNQDGPSVPYQDDPNHSNQVGPTASN